MIKEGNWAVSLLISFLLNALVLWWAIFYHPVEIPKEINVVQPPPFALVMGPLQSPANSVQAFKKQEVKKPDVEKPKPLPKLEVARKAKIVVDKKEKKETEQVKEKPKPEAETEDKTNLEGNAPMDSVYGFGGPSGPVASSPVSGSATSLGKTGEINWESLLFAHLNRLKEYPPQAKRLPKPNGIVKVRITVDTTGRVLSAKIAKKSGNIYLDKAALKLVNKASPVPAPPVEVMGGKSTKIVTVPINYTLKN